MLKQFSKAAHITAGVILLFHILDRLDSGYPFSLFYSVCCLLCFAFAYFGSNLKKLPALNSILLIFESILTGFVAFSFFERGREIVPVVFLLISAMFFITGYRNFTPAISKGKTK